MFAKMRLFLRSSKPAKISGTKRSLNPDKNEKAIKLHELFAAIPPIKFALQAAMKKDANNPPSKILNTPRTIRFQNCSYMPTSIVGYRSITDANDPAKAN